MRSLGRWLTIVLIGLVLFGGGMGLARVWQHYRTATTPGDPLTPPTTPGAPPTSELPGTTEGPLKVAKAYPEPGEVGVMRWSRLLLIFDRPVSQSAIEVGLTIDPPLQLRFEPYGDSGWTIGPITGWTEDRLYDIRVSPQLAGDRGEAIGRELHWSFRTAALPAPEDQQGPDASWDSTLGLTAPVWSPDGKLIAVIRRGQDRYDWQLAVYDIAARKQSIVGPADPVPPVWVDNTRLATSTRGAQPGAGIELRQYDLARDIYRILASPTDLRQYAFAVSPHRAPGGAWLLEVNQGGIDAHSDVSQSLVMLNGGTGTRWLDDPAGTKWFLGWDQAGRALFLNTFENNDHSHSFRYDIMAWEPGSGELSTLVGGGPVAGFGGAAQAGDEIAFWTWTAVDTGSSIDHRPTRLLRYRVEDNELLDLKPQLPPTDGEQPGLSPMQPLYQDCWPSWAPDGSRLAFTSNRGGSWDIWSMNPDGSDPRRLTTDAGEDTHPAWSPDGTTIAFLSSRSGAREVWLMDSAGGNQRPAR